MGNKGQFEKGVSGNPRGRPPHVGGLRRALNRIGREENSNGVTNEAELAGNIWDGLRTGRLQLGFVTLDLDAGGWVALAQMVYGGVPDAVDSRADTPDDNAKG